MTKVITVYLSGPMYLGREQANGWRNEVIEVLMQHALVTPVPSWNVSAKHIARSNGYSFDILNPCDRWARDNDELENEHAFIIKMDKMEIAKSDVLIVNATHPAWGTPIEQYIGWSTGKLVITFADKDSPAIWANAHCHKMCRTHIEAAEYLCHIAAKQLLRVV